MKRLQWADDMDFRNRENNKTGYSGESANPTTFRDWYSLNRCPGSPRDPTALIGLAQRIARRDFRDEIDPASVENRTIRTLESCFVRFDPCKGNQSVPVKRRFVKHFAYWFARGLKDAVRDERPNRAKSTRRYLGQLTGGSYKRESDLYREWSRFLFGEALLRVDRTTRQFVRLHVLERRTLEEVGRVLAMSERTLSRRYGGRKLAEIFQREVGKMVLSIPTEKVERLVYTLYFEDEFSKDEVARLLCLPPDRVESVVRSVAGRVMDAVSIDACKGYFLRSGKNSSSYGETG